jgi:hypothetical protein
MSNKDSILKKIVKQNGKKLKQDLDEQFDQLGSQDSRNIKLRFNSLKNNGTDVELKSLDKLKKSVPSSTNMGANYQAESTEDATSSKNNGLQSYNNKKNS